MLFDEQRVTAERLAIRMETETALRHANAVRGQRSSQRRARQRLSRSARQLLATMTSTRRRPAQVAGATLDVSPSIEPVRGPAVRPAANIVTGPR